MSAGGIDQVGQILLRVDVDRERGAVERQVSDVEDIRRIAVLHVERRIRHGQIAGAAGRRHETDRARKDECRAVEHLQAGDLLDPGREFEASTRR